MLAFKIYRKQTVPQYLRLQQIYNKEQAPKALAKIVS